MGLQSEISIVGGYTFGSTKPTASDRFGGATSAAGSIAFADGTGVGQANQVFQVNLNIAAGVTQTWDLKGGGGELDVLNLPLSMTAVKYVYIEITLPAVGTSLLFGPQGESNAATLWFNANTANFYDTVQSRLLMEDAVAGWALDATHKVIALKNPGVISVTGFLWVFGTK